MSRQTPGRRFGGTGSGPRTADPWDGVLLVDKPTGMTSHDVVYKIRKHFKIRKVGHGGTLDPMATGLLIILTGRGTKLSNQIMGTDKEYEGTLTLGISTSTQDAEGDVLEEKSIEGVTENDIRDALKGMIGDMMQTPPMVSAIKKNGVPLYKLARKGKTVEREPRLIHIYDFTVTSVALPHVQFRLRCTKGTYVRTLCHDIGDTLGCGGHLSQLRRISSGTLHLKNALALDDILSLEPSALFEHILPMSSPDLVASSS